MRDFLMQSRSGAASTVIGNARVTTLLRAARFVWQYSLEDLYPKRIGSAYNYSGRQ